VIETLAREGDARSVKFTQAKISDGRPDLSFSGLKTAVARYVRERNIEPLKNGDKPTSEIKDLAASFQRAVVQALLTTFEKLAVELTPRVLIVAGGVACNASLRESAENMAERLGTPVYFPSKHLSTDNAAMIAAAGYYHLGRGERSDLALTADVTMRLQNHENEDAALKRSKVRYRL
jgi:N6-L-threonylcarbamoyladenine synthase